MHSTMEGNESEIDVDERSPLVPQSRSNEADAVSHVAYRSRWVIIVAQAVISFSNGMVVTQRTSCNRFHHPSYA